MRVKGGNDYLTFVDDLLNLRRNNKDLFEPENYELVVFESLKDLYDQLKIREEKYGLSRLVAGYSWPWISKSDKSKFDIEIDDLKLQWNQTDKDWINSTNAMNEVGCIHTTQGYDLNFTGVIFGEEISFNKETYEIEIDSSKYFDKNGKKGISNKDDLKSYIINIYKTILFRGIRGTFIYACDKNLQDYFKEQMSLYKKKIPLRILKFEDVKPYVNAVPIIDITVAAGNFSELQIHSDYDWVELPINMGVKEGYFVCKVVGESMNKIIPNGSWCLFQKDMGGSREGKIVLVEHYNIQDSDFGAGYTVKSYHSKKEITEDTWLHKSIILRPMSFNTAFEEIQLENEDITELKIVGIFIDVLTY
jgi:hypothetical protein